MSEENQELSVEVNTEMTEIKMADFFNSLSERVSASNARLLMDSVVLTAGLEKEKENCLNVSQVKTVCLELIKRGGPAFQVGKDIYTKIH